MPELKHLHCLLVLSVQRSGSSVICQDLANIGLGQPGEHYLGVLNGTGTLDKFWDRSIQGGFFAVKVMENYLDAFLQFMVKEKEVPFTANSTDYRTSALDYLQSRCASLALVTIKRASALDQAISTYKARLSGQYHSYQDAKLDVKQIPFKEDLLLSILHQQSLMRRRLSELSDAYQGTQFPLVYEHAMENRGSYLEAIAAHFGVDAVSNKNNRYQKVSSSEDVEWIKVQLDRYLNGT